MNRLLIAVLLGLLGGCALLSDATSGQMALVGGQDGHPDYALARARFAAGAAKGDATAEAKYAAMCLAGLGGPVDLPAAVDNLRLSERQHSLVAAMLLADLYTRGVPSVGVPRDLNQALAYAREVEAKRPRPVRDLIARIQRLQQGRSPEAVRIFPPQRGATSDGPPQKLEEVIPDYPIPLQVLDLQAKVIVDFRVTPDGTARDVHVVRPTLPAFDAAAVAAVAASKYLPGVKAGRPVTTHLQVPIEFTTKWF